MAQSGNRYLAKSAIMTRINGVDYPVKTVKTCTVCTSPDRLYIERQLLSGVSYAAIAKSFEDASDSATPLDAGHIQRHVKGDHMPLNAALQVALIHARAKRVGKDIENAIEPLVDHISLAELVVHSTVEQLQSGELTPTIREGLAAATLLEAAKQQEDNLDVSDMQEALMEYMKVVQAIVSPTQLQQIGAQLAASPTLSTIKDRMQARQADSRGLAS